MNKLVEEWNEMVANGLWSVLPDGWPIALIFGIVVTTVIVLLANWPRKQ
jgi:hypothetical protein